CSRRAPSYDGVVRFHGVDVRSHGGALTDVDAISYEIDLKLVDDTPGQVTFTSRTTGIYVAMRPLTSVTLDLEGNRVDALAVDGAAVASAARPSARRRARRVACNLPARAHGAGQRQARVGRRQRRRHADLDLVRAQPDGDLRHPRRRLRRLG